jgi:hypothetical protein
LAILQVSFMLYHFDHKIFIIERYLTYDHAN